MFKQRSTRTSDSKYQYLESIVAFGLEMHVRTHDAVLVQEAWRSHVSHLVGEVSEPAAQSQPHMRVSAEGKAGLCGIWVGMAGF